MGMELFLFIKVTTLFFQKDQIILRNEAWCVSLEKAFVLWVKNLILYKFVFVLNLHASASSVWISVLKESEGEGEPFSVRFVFRILGSRGPWLSDALLHALFKLTSLTLCGKLQSVYTLKENTRLHITALDH